MKHASDEELQLRPAPRSTRRRATHDRPLTLAERVGCTPDSYRELLEKDRQKYGNERWYKELDNG